jgi:hypothetical protein
MTIRLKYNRSFDLEDVVPGDLLMDRQDNLIIYVILKMFPESEEWVCARVGEEGAIKSLLIRIGFEAIDDYIKVDIDD